ncbi:PAS domain S-box protein [Pedobacter sp.]|uniref:PAS domain S-box protein n=1 Tax=Pedobacter sp. TaxID=1411316 RepID=UPI003D7F1D44
MSLSSALNHIISKTPIAIAIVDLNMCYLATSAQWRSFFHCEDKLLIGTSHYSFFPDRKESFQHTVAACLAGNDQKCEPYEWEAADGIIKWLAWQIQSWNEEGGNIGGLMFTVEDITDSAQHMAGTMSFEISQRKQLEEHLYQSETQFKQAFEHSLIGMAIISPEGEWERINKSLSEILGYTEKELKGHNVLEITYKEDLKKSHNILGDFSSRIMDNLKVEKRYIHKNGSLIWVIISATMLTDRNGKRLHLISQIEDITKRKEIENNLLLSEKKYRTIFENVQDVFYRTDEQHNIIEISPSIENHSGYARDFIIGKPVDDFYYYKQDRDKILTALKEKGSVIDFEVRLKTSDHVLRYASVNAHLMFEDGVFIGIEGSMRDVTTRKLQENALKNLNTELTASNQQKSKLLSIIGHDLRNPISGSLQLLDLTLMDFKSTPPDELHQYLSQMKQELSNANNLLEDLLSWAKVQFESMTIQPVEIAELSSHIEKSLLTVKPLAKKKNIAISFENGNCSRIYADRGMLDAIFRNLLTNAIKFTNYNGLIKIKAETIATGVQFSISDNGIGMSKEHISKLCNKNENYSTFGTSGEKGTGLGLNLCHEFVIKSGGQLWVDSMPGVGSTFYFTIPFAAHTKSLTEN